MENKITPRRIIEDWGLSGHLSNAVYSFHQAATTHWLTATIRAIESSIVSLRASKQGKKDTKPIDSAIKTLNQEIARLRKKIQRGVTTNDKPKILQPETNNLAGTMVPKVVDGTKPKTLHEQELKRVDKGVKKAKKAAKKSGSIVLANTTTPAVAAVVKPKKAKKDEIKQTRVVKDGMLEISTEIPGKKPSKKGKSKGKK